MLEALVLALCISGTECNVATKAYLSQRPLYKQNVKMQAKLMQKKMGNEAALLTALAYTGLGSQKLRLRLPINVVAEWKFKDEGQKEVTATWRYDF